MKGRPSEGQNPGLGATERSSFQPPAAWQKEEAQGSTIPDQLACNKHTVIITLP